MQCEINRKTSRSDYVNQANDGDRLIQEVLAELGWDAEPSIIAAKVHRLNLGLPAEDEFTAICSWLGKSRLVHKLGQLQVPKDSRNAYQVPDLLAQFDSTGPLLIEVKSKTKQTLSFTPDYLKRLLAYAELVNMPLLIAWKFYGVWTLFEARHLAKARKNFNIRLGHAMRENLLGILAGDVAFKIASGAGMWLRFKKEELVSVEESRGKVTEQWQTRIDEVGFTIAGGKPATDLDPEVTALFTIWDLTEHQLHSDTHIQLNLVEKTDNLMFSHMALTHLLHWTLPQGAVINWRHAIRRNNVVSNMTNFSHILKRALDQKVVHYILHQQPLSWPDFLSQSSNSHKSSLNK